MNVILQLFCIFVQRTIFNAEIIMRKTGTMLLFCCLFAACSSNKQGNNEQFVTTAEVGVNNKKTTTFKPIELTYPGSEISFKVSVLDKQLIIQPKGLNVSNEVFSHDITGYTVTNAEIGDLNLDSYPEVFVYLQSDGSGSYGELIGYSVNNGKSASQVYLPLISENSKINSGYMGHDEMAIVENTFFRRFPIYKDGDSNAKPTGRMRQIQYKLVDGENGRILEVDKILEF